MSLPFSYLFVQKSFENFHFFLYYKDVAIIRCVLILLEQKLYTVKDFFSIQLRIFFFFWINYILLRSSMLLCVWQIEPFSFNIHISHTYFIRWTFSFREIKTRCNIMGLIDSLALITKYLANVSVVMYWKLKVLEIRFCL